MNKKTELLAPAGTLDICKAVINAGASAVYLGGEKFGARAFAGNLSSEEVTEAIRYAHFYGKKIYLTVNTLLKEKEIGQVCEYIAPFYNAGLDAVIIQDYGVLKLIKEAFPDLSIHASTQMAVMTETLVKDLKEKGVDRIVLPREMHLSEIKDITQHTGVETEVFIHGALCYSYSGECLMSALQGRRSGNRGKCAQICRMPFSGNIAGKKIDELRMLCTKDIVGLSYLPALINAGVNSLKIEGRMKNVNYAAGVTAVYRKYINRYLSNPESDFKIDNKDMDDLMDLYNRGGFSKGFFDNDKGKNLLTFNRANHCGLEALKVEDNNDGCVKFKALRTINAGDVFEIDVDNSFTSGKNLKKGELLTVNLPRRFYLPKGKTVCRMNNACLQKKITEEYVLKNHEKSIYLHAVLKKGCPMELMLEDVETGIRIKVFGEEVQRSEKCGVSEEKIISILSKLGDTPFKILNIDVDAEPSIFISVGGIKKLRRNAISTLTEAIIADTIKRKELNIEKFDYQRKSDIIKWDFAFDYQYTASVYTKDQLDAVFHEKKIYRIYIHYTVLNELKEKFSDYFGKDGSPEIFIALPHVLRQKHLKRFVSFLKNEIPAEADGLLIRSLDQLSVLKKLEENGEYFGPKRIVTDYNVYAYNTSALQFLREYVKDSGFELDTAVYPVELDNKEMSVLNQGVRHELVVYGRHTAMVSEHCIKRSIGKCDAADTFCDLTDSKNNAFKVRSFCDYCYNVIFNNRCINILSAPDFDKYIKPAFLRFDFTDESGECVRELLKDFLLFNDYDNIGTKYTGRFFESIE